MKYDLVTNPILLGPYRNEFDPKQIELEASVAHYLESNTQVDQATANAMAAFLVKLVLGTFKPELFKPSNPEDELVCAQCGGTNLQSLVWRNAHTLEQDEDRGHSVDGADWCEDCSNYVHFVPRRLFRTLGTCPDCEGIGYVEVEKDIPQPCKSCQGDGLVSTQSS